MCREKRFFDSGANELMYSYQLLTQVNPTCDLSVEFMNLMTSTVSRGCAGNPDFDAAYRHAYYRRYLHHRWPVGLWCYTNVSDELCVRMEGDLRSRLPR